MLSVPGVYKSNERIKRRKLFLFAKLFFILL